MLPKSSAEILAGAKRARAPSKQTRKAKVHHNLPFLQHLSTFPITPFAEMSTASIPTVLPQSARSQGVHHINNIRFVDPIMPKSLEPALEVDTDIDECSEDLFDDDSASVPTWASASGPESPNDDLGRLQTSITLSERISDVLDMLQKHRLSPFDLVIGILDEDKTQYSDYRTEFYEVGSQKLFKILDVILASHSGKRKLKTWIQQPAAVELVCESIAEEMTCVQKAEALPGIASITPEFIRSWTISPNEELAPYLKQVLFSASETTIAKDKNKKKKPVLCNVVLKQLSYQRSNNSLGFPTLFGLFLWATGCAPQTIDALHKCGLSISHSSVLKAISYLASRCIELATEIGSGIHVFCYGNVNMSTSIFVELGASTPTMVTSGTFAVLYKVRNGNPDHMKIGPIIQRFKQVKGLKFNQDLQPTVMQLQSFLFQLKVVVIRVLIKYVKGFESYAGDPDIQHKPRRSMPKGYVTEQFPLRATTIDGATVRGNLSFHDDVYVTQLKRSSDQLSEYAIPSINDQPTNARIRSGQILRARDVDAWERREIFQLGFGLFHLCKSLVWALLHVHRGSLGDAGSLTYFFALLGNDHLNYHTLLAALKQIFDGLILNAWRIETAEKHLSDFAASKPSVVGLLEIAGRLLLHHATPMEHAETLAEDDTSDEEDEAPQPSSTRRQKLPVPPVVSLNFISPDPEEDKAHQNLRLLTRDLLYLTELISAISDGDIGRIEDFFPQLAMMFRGAGGNNYCTEILHFILNLKYVWTPEFADIMRDNMLVNLTGLEGHAMPIDLNMEDLIGQLKDLLAVKGLELESTWDRLDISATIDYLNKIKKKMGSTLKTSYQGSTHTPDAENLVWRVANRARNEEFQIFRANRDGNAKRKSTVDILATGEAKLRSSSLATFNRKGMDAWVAFSVHGAL